MATDEDVARIDRLDEAWSKALAEAREAGFGQALKAEGELLDPEAALARAAPTPGSYMCRVTKLGALTPKDKAYAAFKPFFCHIGVDGDLLTITKQTGSQRPAGFLWETDDSSRLIFLGSMALGDEESPLPYGEDRQRDMAGVFERIGPLRFRLVVPWPRIDSKLDVFELVPAPVQTE